MTQAQAIPATRTRSVRTIAGAVLGAAIANIAIFLAFRAAGASYENTRIPEPVGLPAVLVLTVVPMLIGVTAVALLSRRWPALLSIGRWAGPALALATIAIPATSGFDALSFIALALMHTIVATAVLVSLSALKH